MMLEKWNPVVKAATVLVCVLLLSVQYLVTLNLLVFVVSVALLLTGSHAGVRRIVSILIPAGVAAFGLFMMGLYYARSPGAQEVELAAISAMPYAVRAAMSRNLYTGLQLSTRLLAYAGLGVLFALSTDSDFFISSLLHQCHLPPKFAYGILAAFHLIPGMIREYKKVRTAYAVRGVRTHAWSVRPMFTMLVNSVRWSESVAMAMESKGFCGDAPRTYYQITRLHARDWLLAAACIGGVIAGMMMLQY